MKRSFIIGLLLVSNLLLSKEAYADLVADYHGRKEAAQSISFGFLGFSSLPGNANSPIEYRTRLYIVDDVMAVQFIVDDLVVREVGFDFENNYYFDIDPIKNDYLRYSFDVTAQQYALLKTGKMAQNNPMPFFDSTTNPHVDYSVQISRDFLTLTNKISGHKVKKYRFNDTTRDKKLFNGSVWVSTDIPNISHYSAIIQKLKQHGRFYKAVNNEVSDLIILMQITSGLPMKIDYRSEKSVMFMSASLKVQSELISVSEQIINKNDINYFLNQSRFDTNLKILGSPSDSAQPKLFGSSAATLSGTSGYIKGSPGSPKATHIDWLDRMEYFLMVLIVAGIVFVIVYKIFHMDSHVFPFIIGGKDLTGLLVIDMILFTLILFHGLTKVPFMGNFIIEAMIVITVGSAVAMMNAMHQIKVSQQIIASGKYNQCKRCKRLVDKIAAVCPSCSQKIQ